MHVALVAAFLLQAVAPDTVTLKGARSPAYLPDGRIVVAIEGDLFLQGAAGTPLKRLTSGLAWDRDPAVSKDGRTVVFSSDRDGNFDLYRLALTADGAPGGIERIGGTAEPESAPTIAPDGTIAFVRGSGNATRIWLRAPDGTEKRLNSRDQTESAPRFSPDGARIAYVAIAESGRRAYVRTVAGGSETTVNADRNPERLAWSPTGDRVAFSTRAGIFVAPPDGRWTNFVSARHGDLAWSPDAKSLAVAEYDEVSVGYNGDPDRVKARTASENFGTIRDRFYLVQAPIAPDAGLAEQTLRGDRDRAARNAEAFDRVWERSTKLYFAQPSARRTQWEQVKTKVRPQAIAAVDDAALQEAIWQLLRQRPPLKEAATGRAAVSSAHPVATEAGLAVLRAGGNVVDAAAAVSFALGVVEPDASGVGGYGEMVISLSKLEKPTLIEFMSRVPEDAGLSNTSLLVNGRYPSDGPVLTNVPGTVAGMYAAVKKYGSGKVTWKEILAPAIKAAREGYVVSEGLATTLATERDHFVKYEGSRALFFRNGEPLHAGDTLKNPDLAWVFEQIAANGADGFYKGEVAKKWVADLRSKGNAMKLTDLERYFAPEREPVKGTYRGYTIYSSAPPVSGGAELAARLNLLEHFPSPKAYTEDAATLHAIMTAWQLTPSTRNRVSDPSLWPTDIEPIINRDTANVRWGCYKADRALRPNDLRGDTLACLKAAATTAPASVQKPTDDGVQLAGIASPCGADHALEVDFCHQSGTTAFTVADNEGNVVAVTQTLGTWGGTFYVTPGLGFLSNDKLTSYGTDPTQYGARLPFMRHGSTLAPTIAFKGKKPVFAIGAAGNAWITSAVYQGLLGALDYGLDPQRALELPRFLPGGGGGGGGRAGGPGGAGGAAAAPPTEAPVGIQMEDGFSPAVIKRLRELGYEPSFVSLRGELREGYGAAVAIDGKKVTAGADPRRAGAAGAIP